MPERKSTFKKVLLAISVLFFLLICIGIYRVLTPSTHVPEKGVLILKVGGEVVETREESDFPFFAQAVQPGLQELMSALAKAKQDERIKLVLLEIGPLATDFAKLSELRSAIDKFQTSGKQVWAYTSFPGDQEYYLASTCDKIYLEPYTGMFIDGLKAESFYFHEALKKVGVEVEVVRRGKYKSAVEPFVGDKSSPESQEQQAALLDDIDRNYVEAVAKDRKFTEAEYRRIIKDVAFITPEKSVELKLADSLTGLQNLKKKIRKQYGVSDDDDKFFVGERTYVSVDPESVGIVEGEKIALINVIGGIFEGMDGAGSVSVDAIVKSIDEARKNKDIKAIILRVDSPGGSAVGPDKIIEALDSAKTEKPVIASFSGVAASGGYWIAAHASKIVANPTTTTGSIGVFFLKPYLSDLEDNIGVKREVITRGKFADEFNFFDKFSPDAYEKFDRYIGEFYNTFLTMVAEGRKMSVAKVDSVGQGRVWSGERAKAVGLVDELGGLDKAVQVAKDLAGIDSASAVTLISYPKKRTFYEAIFDDSEATIYESFTRMLARDIRREVMADLFGDGVLTGQAEKAQGWLRLLTGTEAMRPKAMMPYEMVVR
ncbi:MAG: signal peptide peptidase SppA [Chlorobiales bacterium]|nr:signal peptide peptidase SppA [Chlorobiales bacterium]